MGPDQDARIRRLHTCRCPSCDPGVDVHPERQGPHHVGVRFWDQDEEPNGPGAYVALDGARVDRAFEAILGEAGIVWAYTGPVPHVCLTCRDRAAAEGLVSDDGYRLVVADGGETQAISFRLCTTRLVGAVELRWGARS